MTSLPSSNHSHILPLNYGGFQTIFLDLSLILAVFAILLGIVNVSLLICTYAPDLKT